MAEVIRLQPYEGTWPPDDPDAEFRRLVPEYSRMDPLPTLDVLRRRVHAWISFSCRDEAHVNEGERLEECIRQIEASRFVEAVGINCTSPRYIPPLIREAKKATSKPVLVYPNSGESYDATKSDWDGHPVYESFGDEAKVWYDAGARLIGGCCRTSPKDIQDIASGVRSSHK